jgi:thiamine-phosphate pyrophosphorylase
MVRQARALTSRPLVAIGGITRENARAVVEAGADGVAVVSDLLDAADLARAFTQLAAAIRG